MHNHIHFSLLIRVMAYLLDVPNMKASGDVGWLVLLDLEDLMDYLWLFT
jgi:hypothetical protein